MAGNKRFVPYADIAKVKEQLVKDNAQPRIKPPQMAKKPQPGLAPPGMSGIKTEKRFALPKPAHEQQKQAFSPLQGNLRRAFKSLAGNRTRNGPDIER